ncbi:MAG: phosphotransferase family protein [Desulfobacteraceae bacterium]|jgi:aminoglycoside phosphotransferase (APT) family kinase protein|nr:phosphotransferase family protein [Desulfobacteraceae bacterium]
MELIDPTRPVREGEDLDTERIGAYLARTLDLEGPPTIRQFPGGYSNLTYFIAAGGRELVLRRPPFGTKAAKAHDMGREYRILKALRPVYPYVPEALAYCEDPAVIGAPFYLMERIRGIILRKELPPGLSYSPDQARTLCLRLLEAQVALHRIDFTAAGLADLGHPEGYVQRQVDGWSRRYRAAGTEDAPDFEAVMTWLSDHRPPDCPRPGLVHNDFRLDNVVLDPTDPVRIIGVLDWEMATIGDPLMDLGNSLAYWIEAGDGEEMQALRLMPTHIPGALTRAELVVAYGEKSGLDVGDIAFYYVFGLFRLAVIAQQIYYRYFHGQTRDPRFAVLIFAVAALERRAAEVIAGGRI